jgi:membrane fusion protein (multidrug efflux system)
MLLPQQAVFRDPKGNPLTFIVDQNGKVEQRTLKLDRAIGDAWLVSSGITAGERVIIEGMQKVRPGINVKTVPFEKKEKSAGTDNFQTPPSKTN